MALTPVKCPRCEGINVSHNGISKRGVQRYICNNKECSEKSFMLEYAYNGWKPGIDEQIIEMAANASGIRDTSRVLKVSKQKVSDTLKKRKKQ